MGKRKRIMLTGGGSAGHVTVNLALIPEFLRRGWDITYVGSHHGVERELVASMQGVRYMAISTGKLRRYLSWDNMTDSLRVIKGIAEAYRLIKQERPDVIFSKGGFVSVPVVIGGWLNRVPVVIHESDVTPGLANRIAMPFAARVCLTFPEQQDPSGKKIWVGAVVRDDVKRGDASMGRSLCGFSGSKPVLLVVGGSLGSQRINQLVRRNLATLLDQFQIAHICGKGQVDPHAERAGYKQFGFVQEEFPHLLALADMVVSRAGSNAIFEFLSLRKPMLLIPLSRKASRGDQILNADFFRRQGYAEVLQDEELDDNRFCQAILQVKERRHQYVERMSQGSRNDALNRLLQIITEAAAHS
jgi:UDP-N-acetylglucosamine--N-acetylmuramyl-(pentapeptide) pyrophosphoryl-undecaprenol N-acetylglucosamine transferase